MDFGRFSGQSGTKYGASPFPVSGGLATPINIQGYLGSIMVHSVTLIGRNSGVECLLPKQDIPRLANQIHDCPYSVGVRG